MNDKNLQNIWNAENENSNLNFDFSTLESQNTIKIKREINILIIRRIVEATIFIICAGFLVNFGIENASNLQFLLSALALFIFTVIGISGSFSQVVLALNLDYSENITNFQLKLQRLKTHSLQLMKLLFLSVPFYLAYAIIGFKYFLNFDIISNANSAWLISNIVFSILLIPLSIWFYKKLSYKSESKWVKKLINDNGGKQLNSAMNFLNEIDHFKQEKIK